MKIFFFSTISIDENDLIASLTFSKGTVLKVFPCVMKFEQNLHVLLHPRVRDIEKEIDFFVS